MRWPLLLLVLLLTGCGARSQLQVVADTRAAAQAAAAMPDGPARARLYEAIGRSVVAMTEDLPGLPAPTWTPQEIAAEPETFIEATAETAANPPKHEPLPVDEHREPSLRDRLADDGNRLIGWGKWAAIGGLVLSLLGMAYGAFGWTFLGWIGRLLIAPFLAPVFRLVASLGCGMVGVGASMVWLAANLWWFLGSLAVIGAGVAAYHHRDIAAAWDRLRAGLARLWARFRPTPKPKV